MPVDGNVERLLKEQVSEMRSLLSDYHMRTSRLVEDHMESMRQLKGDMSDLRSENQRLRQQMQAVTSLSSSSSPPWDGMGGTGESGSSDSRSNRDGAAAQEDRQKPAPPPYSLNIPGSTNEEVVDAQTIQVPSVSPRTSKRPGRPSFLPGLAKVSGRASWMPTVSRGSGDPDEKVVMEDVKDVDFKTVVPMSARPSDGSKSNRDDQQSRNTKKRKSSIAQAIGREDEATGAPKAVFADAAAMKEKLRAALHAPEYNVADYYWETGFWQKIARSHVFENFTLVVIAANALWIWIDTDYNHHEVLLDADIGFFIGENAFCVYFSFEWIVRFMSFKRKRDGFKDSWFMFDSCLVFMMVIETWIVNAIIALTSTKSGGGMGNASILRLLRLLRLTRMARMARLLRAMPELMILIKGISVATRSVLFTLLLLLLIIYLFAIAFVTLTKDTSIGEQYFKTVPAAMDTLLLGGTLPDHEEIVNNVGSSHFLLKLLFLVFMLLGSLTVMNMLMGVLVEVVSVVSAVEKEQMVVNFVKLQLQTLLKTEGLDANCDNQISKAEFEALLEKPMAARALQDVGVDVVGLVDFTDFIFKDGIQLSFPDFMEMVLQLRGTNTATVKDIVDFRKFVHLEFVRLEERISGRILTGLGEMGMESSIDGTAYSDGGDRFGGSTWVPDIRCSGGMATGLA